MLQLTPRAGWTAKDYIEHLYRAFAASDRYKRLVRKNTRCVRINYANEFHVDLEPYVEADAGGFVTNCDEPDGIGTYEPSDPQAFTAWIAARDAATNGHFVPEVRLIKHLRDFKNTFTCKSIILLTLLGQQIDLGAPRSNSGKYADLSSTLRSLVVALAGTLPTAMPTILAPDGSGDDLSARYRSDWDYHNFRSAIIRYAERIDRAFRDAGLARSLRAWQGVFGPEFSPFSTKALTEIAPYRATTPWRNEQFIDRPPFGFPIQLDPNARLTLIGRCIGGTGAMLNRKFRAFDLASTNGQVAAGRRLRFTVSISGVTPDEIYWKVRNGGADAARAGKLRGEISRDGGNRTKDEPTLYPGTHYVESYAVRGGVVVASGRQKVVITR